jgi:hypothetical protein
VEAVLEASQLTVVGAPEALTKYLEYIVIGESGMFTPILIISTGGKDDPRLDSFFRLGKILRCFIRRW